jgi:membrane dipeptidase
MLLFDAHLDLALNAVEWNRDLTRPLSELRASEAQLNDKPDRRNGTVCLPEMRKAKIGICVATQLARVERNAWSPVSGWHSPEQAWAMTQAQRAWYEAMEDAGHLLQIRTRPQLEAHIQRWQDALQEGKGRHECMPIGYILSLEGCDSLVRLANLEKAWNYGLRAIGPAHYGPGIYANGTDSSGGLNFRGRELLREARQLGMILDATHLCDDAFFDALDLWDGPIWASHHNCRSLVPHNRQLSDEMIRLLAERDAVIGLVFDAWMLYPNWQRGKTTPQSSGVTLATALEHVDHICQLTGTTHHCGIGSDLDGAFGIEQTPQDLNSIADLQKVGPLLRSKGYSDADVTGIFHENFLRIARHALPQE